MKSLLFSTLALFAVAAFSPTPLVAQEDAMSTEETSDIITLASGNQDLSILVAAVKAADLVETLQGDGPFTVFAPTDEAFRALPTEVFQALLKAENRQALVDILKYHVADGKLAASDVMAGIEGADNGELMATTMNGDFTASLSGENVTLTDAQGNAATVVQPDVMASNGVVHVIDRVLLPANLDVEALIAGEAMGMKEEADEMKDDAVTAGKEMANETMEAGEEMANETMEAGEEMAGEARETMNETTGAVRQEVDRMVNTTETEQGMSPSTQQMGSDVRGNNSIVDVAAGNDDFKTLVAAVKAAELVDLLDGSESDFTVFAPTEAAFGKLPEGTVGELTQSQNKEKLQGILSYHVLANRVDAASLTEAIEANNGFFRIQTISGQSLIASIVDGNVVLTDGNGGMATVTATDVAADNGVIHVIDTVLMPK